MMGDRAIMKRNGADKRDRRRGSSTSAKMEARHRRCRKQEIVCIQCKSRAAMWPAWLEKEEELWQRKITEGTVERAQ